METEEMKKRGFGEKLQVNESDGQQTPWVSSGICKQEVWGFDGVGINSPSCRARSSLVWSGGVRWGHWLWSEQDSRTTVCGSEISRDHVKVLKWPSAGCFPLHFFTQNLIQMKMCFWNVHLSFSGLWAPIIIGEELPWQQGSCQTLSYYMCLFKLICLWTPNKSGVNKSLGGGVKYLSVNRIWQFRLNRVPPLCTRIKKKSF